MRPFAQRFGRIYKYVCTTILACMVLIVFFNTILRYFFNTGIVENEEILRYLFIWATFLGIVAVYYEGGHISVTFLIEKLPPRAAPLFAFCMNFLVLFALGLFVFGCVQFCFASRSTVGQMTGLPFVYIIIAGIFCGLASFGIVARDMRRQLRSYRQLRASSGGQE